MTDRLAVTRGDCVRCPTLSSSPSHQWQPAAPLSYSHVGSVSSDATHNPQYSHYMSHTQQTYIIIIIIIIIIIVRCKFPELTF